MKIKSLLFIAATLMSVATPMAARAEDADDANVIALATVSARLSGNKSAAALCITVVGPKSTFCYYHFDRTTGKRDDDGGFNNFIRELKGYGTHGDWARKKQLGVDFDNQNPGIENLVGHFYEDPERFNTKLEELRSKGLRVHILDLGNSAPNIWVDEERAFAKRTHQRVFAAVASSEESDAPGNAEEHKERIAELVRQNDALRVDLEAARKEVVKNREQADKTREELADALADGTDGGAWPDLAFFSGNNGMKISLAIGILVALLVYPSFLVIRRARKRPRSVGGSKENNLEVASDQSNDVVQSVRESTEDQKLRRAAERLQERLCKEELDGEDFTTVADQAIGLLDELCERLRGLTGAQDDTEPLRSLVGSIENYMRLLRPSTASESHEQISSFVDLVQSWKSIKAECQTLRTGLEAIPGISSEDLEEGSISDETALARLKDAVEIQRQLQELCPHEETSSIVRNLCSVCRIFIKECEIASELPSAEILEQVKSIFIVLERLARDFNFATTPVAILEQVERKVETLTEQRDLLESEAEDIKRATEGLARSQLPVNGSPSSPLEIVEGVESELEDSKRQITDLQDTVDRLRTREQELIAIETFLTAQADGIPEEPALDKIQRLAQSHSEGLELLRGHRSGDAFNLKESVETVVDYIERAKKAVRRVLPEEDGHIDELTEKLAVSHEQLETAFQENRELCRLFSEYLNLGWNEFTRGDAIHGYIDVLKRELNSDLRPLRLGLCATLILWRRILEVLARRPEGHRLVHVLRLPAVQQGLEMLMERLEHLETDELWVKGIRPGFSRDWMHDLFRAELLLESFYVGNSDHQDLEDTIGLAATTLRSAMQRLGKSVEGVELLEPFPSQRPAGWADPRYAADRELRTLPEVNQRVRELLESNSDDFIVDVESFRLRGDSEHPGECRVVVVNPAEWRQA